jgi:formylglycine-generating enzyme required for sulfatase activity
MKIVRLRHLHIFVGFLLAFQLILPCPVFSQETLEYQGIKFRPIPGGSYVIGSPPQEPGRYVDEPQPQRVSLEPFYIAVTETTNAQYARFLKATGHPPPLYWEDKNLNGPTLPVVGVTWHDAAAFAQWLTQITGFLHRLPTEAQWEAAARGGLSGKAYPWGDDPPDAGGAPRANYRAGGRHLTMPVASFPPNGFGLFDMAGNAAEWCHDRYTPSPSRGPFKPGVQRLLKGGSWFSLARDLRCAARQSAPLDYADGYIGFRVVRLSKPD